MGKVLTAILILTTIIPVVACSGKPSFETERAAIVDYLNAFNKVDSDLSDTTAAILSSHQQILIPDVLQVNRTLTQLLAAFQGGLQRANTLKSPNDQSTAHLHAFKKYVQDNIAAIQNLQAAIASGNEAATSKASDELDVASNQASPMNRLTESLMVKYNITDSEVNYRFRGE